MNKLALAVLTLLCAAPLRAVGPTGKVNATGGSPSWGIFRPVSLEQAQRFQQRLPGASKLDLSDPRQRMALAPLIAAFQKHTGGAAAPLDAGAVALHWAKEQVSGWAGSTRLLAANETDLGKLAEYAAAMRRAQDLVGFYVAPEEAAAFKKASEETARRLPYELKRKVVLWARALAADESVSDEEAVVGNEPSSSAAETAAREHFEAMRRSKESAVHLEHLDALTGLVKKNPEDERAHALAAEAGLWALRQPYFTLDTYGKGGRWKGVRDHRADVFDELGTLANASRFGSVKSRVAASLIASASLVERLDAAYPGKKLHVPETVTETVQWIAVDPGVLKAALDELRKDTADRAWKRANLEGLEEHLAWELGARTTVSKKPGVDSAKTGKTSSRSTWMARYIAGAALAGVLIWHAPPELQLVVIAVGLGFMLWAIFFMGRRL